MGKAKWWLVSGIVLILAGCVIFGGVMMALGWDFFKLTMDKYETNTYEISEKYNNICVRTTEADVQFVPSEDENTCVIIYGNEKFIYNASVADDTLYVEQRDERSWIQRFGFHFRKQKITVKLPLGAYGDLQLNSVTGDVKLPRNCSFENVELDLVTADAQVEDVTAAGVEIRVTTGDVTVKNTACSGDVNVYVTTGDLELEALTCGSFTTDGTTGEVSLHNVVVQQKLSVTRTTGDVEFEKCDAGEIFVKSGTGDVTGSLLSGKAFQTKTTTGSIKVPQSTTGGKCEIITTSGSIRITVE